MAVEYMIGTDIWNILLKKDGPECYVWNKKTKEWIPNADVIGYFWGFDPGKRISEEEAKEIMGK